MNHKEITVFTEGNSQNANVWSNVPYFLTNTLESKGYLVHRVNVEGNLAVKKFYDKFLCRILRKTFMKKTSFSYNRSKSHAKKVNLLMQQAVKKYPNSFCFISTSFSFCPFPFTENPSVLFCDWSYEYYIKHFLRKKPDFLEKREILRQNKVIELASDIFVLFPDVAAYMKDYYKNKNIFYLGNVINADMFERDPASLSRRCKIPNILFIGLKKYRDGANSLIEAIKYLHCSIPNITLDIIGMENRDFAQLPSYIHCHGYLDKNLPSQKDLYYSLINNATVYVNTTPHWAGFSSALEALYHYVPIITTPYPSFTETFGSKIPFGYYCDENTCDAISSYLNQLLHLSTNEYISLCEQAHFSVSKFTWSAYVDSMLSFINQHVSQ